MTGVKRWWSAVVATSAPRTRSPQPKLTVSGATDDLRLNAKGTRKAYDASLKR